LEPAADADPARRGARTRCVGESEADSRPDIRTRHAEKSGFRAPRRNGDRVRARRRPRRHRALYTVDLNTGKATKTGNVAGTANAIDFAIQPIKK
jgi:hypothetical protein